MGVFINALVAAASLISQAKPSRQRSSADHPAIDDIK